VKKLERKGFHLSENTSSASGPLYAKQADPACSRRD
jgi:hypothetical protein